MTALLVCRAAQLGGVNLLQVGGAQALAGIPDGADLSVPVHRLRCGSNSMCVSGGDGKSRAAHGAAGEV